MPVSISLGSEDRVSQLYSFKNSPSLNWTVAQTVKHWFDMTLDRDGLKAQGAKSSVSVVRGNYVLKLDGPDAIQAQLQEYAVRLPQFLTNGWDALTNVIPTIKADGRWDPSPDVPGPKDPPYEPWSFFLPLGMTMLNQKALLFFHSPPIRLLRTNQDYLDDPVPVRCEELLTANGVSDSDLPLFNTVMDATPIGAEDDQGSKKAGDPDFGLIPIQDFPDYQRSQVKLLLNVSLKDSGYTVPIVVYGAHPLAIFNKLYGTKLKNNQVTVVEIIPGKKTAVMASTHPYVFYGMAQGFDKIGSGKIVNHRAATAQMKKDLVVARWLKSMAEFPNQSPKTALKDAQSYWSDPAQNDVIKALVNHQGSLTYSDPTTLAFNFAVPLNLPKSVPGTRGVVASAAAAPAATARVVTPPAKPAKKATAKTTAAKTTTAVKPAAQPVAPGGKLKTLTVIGDAGKPVDWWFIYKLSAESKTPDGKPIDGSQYVYFDSEMAKNNDAKLVLSPNGIDQTKGALFNTFSQLFSASTKQNKNLGWYTYNDEDHQTKSKKGELKGSGPSDRGHCKGALAFDLVNNTAFWLIHSVPLFPLTNQYEYPATGHKMAQTMLCIQLADADTAKNIAQLMYDAHGPNVNVASDLLVKTAKRPYGFPTDQLPLTNVPKLLGDGTTTPTDPRLQLMRNLNGSMGRKLKPYSGRVPFKSRGGENFIAIAKNKAWGNPKVDPDATPDNPKDFYNELVSVVLNEDIDVETWENAGTKIPPEVEKGETHKVENMQSIDLGLLDDKLQYSWSEKVDHAKLAISDRDNGDNTPRWVCVGDINFTDAQDQRGGGTVAFKCPTLWNSLSKILSPKPESSGSSGKKATTKKPTTKSATTKPATAKKAAIKKATTKKSAVKKTATKK